MEVKSGPLLQAARSQLGGGNRPEWAGEAAARLARTIEEAILEATHSTVLNLSVHLTPSEVILRGRCRSFHVKQKAQHAAMRVCEELEVVNEIQVL